MRQYSRVGGRLVIWNSPEIILFGGELDILIHILAQTMPANVRALKSLGEQACKVSVSNRKYGKINLFGVTNLRGNIRARANHPVLVTPEYRKM